VGDGGYLSTVYPVDNMSEEAEVTCGCKEADHHVDGCANHATGRDGLCDDCRTAKELSDTKRLHELISGLWSSR
jgi:hypothetical protein